MTACIGRRDLITLLGGAAAWPLAARAQQRTILPQVGILDPGIPQRFEAFRRGMRDLGYVEGKGISYIYLTAAGRAEPVSQLASELVSLNPDVIVAASPVPVRALKAATATIPIVFVVEEDPVRLGLVASLARPGGNLTGINLVSGELTAKRLELLRELVPGAARIGVLVNPANATTTESTLRDVQPAASAMGLQTQVFNASTSHEIDMAFATFVRERCDAVFVGIDVFFNSRRAQLVNLASRHALPATFVNRDFAEIGGLMSYGTNIADAFRQVGVYAGHILKGAKPADLPVLQPTKFELVINAQTARMLGLEIPPTLLARADEVIE